MTFEDEAVAASGPVVSPDPDLRLAAMLRIDAASNETTVRMEPQRSSTMRKSALKSASSHDTSGNRSVQVRQST